MSNFWKWLLGLLALALLIWLCLRNHAPEIQAELQTATNGALTEQSYSWANATADGREITLTGIAPSLAAKEDAGRIAADIEGVRTVTNNLEVLTAISPYVTQAKYDGSKLLLTGHVPNEEARTSVVNEAENLFSNATIIDKLTIGAGHANGWRDAFSRGMKNLAQLNNGMTQVEDLKLIVRGRAADIAHKNTLDKAVIAPLTGNFTASSEITAPQPKPVTAPKPVVAAISCQKEFNNALSENTILFATSSAEIDSSSYALLDQLVATAAKCPDASIEVGGHTDSVGDASMNQSLSEARANSVISYLTSKGISAERLNAVGYGENNPIADNDSREGRSINRRIELQVEGL